MATYLVALAFLAVSLNVNAQLINAPQCALNCFMTPLGSDGCSQLTDFVCHCKKINSLVASVTPCVQKACSASDQAATISALESTCDSAGVSVSLEISTSTIAASASRSSAAATSSHSRPVTTSQGSLAASKTTLATSTISQTATPTPPPPPPPPSGLSPGAAAGLGVGVTLVAALAAFGAYLLWKKRRSKVPVTSEDLPEKVTTETVAPETAFSETKAWTGQNEFHEAGGRSITPYGELEDRHGTKVAREWERRTELT